MTQATVMSGRAASMMRRRALAQGKTALPAPRERTRVGFREAALPAAPAGVAAASAPTQPAPTPRAAAPATPTPPGMMGRMLAMLRRRQLAAGKQALDVAAAQSAASPAAEPTNRAAASEAPPALPPNGSGRELARARRAAMALRGRGDAPAGTPSRPPRQGKLEYAPKVIASPTQGGQRVTGLRIGRGAQVTGDEPGTNLPVSGTQYVGTDSGVARPAAPKVGQVRTAAGLIVSGTLVRGKVRITGDEAGDAIAITGEADQRIDDDLTPRDDFAPSSAAQFARQANPHGHSVFGTNLGRSVRTIGSRERDRSRAIEVTEGGQPITGSAVGRSARVTGDEEGACRAITGDQYLTPARAQAECGNGAGGTAPAELIGAARRDPVTISKVTQSQTWGAQRVTGPSVEHRPNVTGDEPGSCAVITGTPYQGPSTAYGWCEPQAALAAEARNVAQPAGAPVTGDAPVNAPEVVTGTERGAGRDITGTPYYREAPAASVPQDRLATIAQRFTIRTPQRQAQLRADRSAVAAPSAAARITGTFALGQGKITGNVEFAFRPRLPGEKPARLQVSGEGRTQGLPITGDAWREQANVTGTEGYIAAERNPSQRAGKPLAFANAGLFKSKGHHEEPRQIVTGMVGWTAKSAAKVTLSGGAQG